LSCASLSTERVMVAVHLSLASILPQAAA